MDATGRISTVACPNCGLSHSVQKLAHVAETGSSGQAKWWLLSAGVAAAMLVAGLMLWQAHLRPIIPITPAPALEQSASTSPGMADSSASTTAIVETSSSVAPAQTKTVTPSATLAPEPPKTAQIWFAPFMFGQGAPAWQNGFGAHDYLEFFKEGAPWNKASSRIQVFKFYINVLNRMSDAQLEQVVQDLNRRGIAIGVEAYLIWTDRSSQPFRKLLPGIQRMLHVADCTQNQSRWRDIALRRNGSSPL